HGATTWLCKPGARPDPCAGSLRTTVIDSSGQSHVENPKNAKRPPIDCFYVYPTVSDDKSENSDLSIDPEEISIAQYQASRFSQRCRVFAPMYRQLTLQGLNSTPPPDALLTAYGDVRAAWKEYMRRYNHGRGVVLIGHSQGSGMLEELVRQKIDRFPAARRRLLSAILLGGNVTVAQGRNLGGVFRHVPGCRSPRRLACVIAYSTFGKTPPDDAIFGKGPGVLSQAFNQAEPANTEVLCTNPAALRGGVGALQTLSPTAPFNGTVGLGISILYNGSPPTAPTPWVEPQDHYTGRCVQSNGANVLMISPVAGARQLSAVPDDRWGLHLADMNIALGNLVDVVRAETKAFLKRRAKRK
ncbi:MAG: DUF3089 domain-containing protein, partial [Solirubrobacterales bacterium]